jgi:hypothetical protein
VGAVQSALGVGGCDRDTSILATCSLLFAKVGNAATLSQQEKNKSEEKQQDGIITRGDVSSTSSCRLLIASRRAPPPTHV